MNARQLIIAGSLNMVLGVGAGAFGAHGLKAVLSPAQLAIWQTAVSYQQLHALGLILVGALASRLGPSATARIGNCMLAGIIVFSGSLYALALSGIKLLGAITPLGGVALLAAWLMLAWAAYRSSQGAE
ncbi:DUF423 domain-containing protein [Chitinimonas viridis]|uniref:DUF423 domain-containing protein n=1 Tax=Chitinimonas viridis TaxID=664880 RepID=A0ABT8B1V6_9NEIS|nr:DUF423 domain-containing protein [Chitinimonas viridis]MDN3575705.1 DUF423 domain-containing protein [Chitinimonas viridis]